jgi:hypothetical protein
METHHGFISALNGVFFLRARSLFSCKAMTRADAVVSVGNSAFLSFCMFAQ